MAAAASASASAVNWTAVSFWYLVSSSWFLSAGVCMFWLAVFVQNIPEKRQRNNRKDKKIRIFFFKKAQNTKQNGGKGAQMEHPSNRRNSVTFATLFHILTVKLYSRQQLNPFIEIQFDN